jgi:ribonuclease HII
MILGIDEVGRGPWAGPLVVGAVVLPEPITIEGLTDSKKLSAKRRAELDVLIRQEALGWGLGWVHADELDTVGLSAALRLATVRAVEAVKVPYHEIMIDGTINFLSDTTKGQYVTTMAKADLLIPAVSAASIIAKVARDTYMEAQDALYPAYGFASHVGYGTARHQKALEEHGVTILHRTSFAPIKKLLHDTSPVMVHHPNTTLTAKAVGNQAEQAVATWLATQGFRIVERNWKTRFCEIDCIAEKNSVHYFIEVKYRTSHRQGGAIAAITPKKLQQMRFGAELYQAGHHDTLAMRLAVVTVASNGDSSFLEVE